jgi:8-oxo-dGTP pyrophosphatase MutT (NUDIX family)
MDEKNQPRNQDKPVKIGPWTRLSTRMVYDNAWIRVQEDRVLRPDGAPGIYGTVHYKNLAIGVVPIDAQGRVILVGQHRYPLDYYSWEIPEGGCLIGEETSEASAKRELREETGYTAKKWDYLGEMVVSNSVSDEVAHFYLARDLTAGQTQMEGTEEIAVQQMDLMEAYRQAMTGEITESLTVAALARAKYFLEQEKKGGA